MGELKYYVLTEDYGTGEITKFNVFDSVTFKRRIEELHKNGKKYKLIQLVEEVKSALFYSFASKSEYEIIVKPFVGNKNCKETKIDVYKQVMLNFDLFIDYLFYELGWYY